MRFTLLFLLLVAIACVKDEGVVGAGKTSDETTGGATSGSTAGGVTGGSTGGTPATDPLLTESWHLENTGQKAFSLTNAQRVGEDIKVKDVHGEMNIRGRGIRIAVSDTGTEVGQEDLFPNTLAGEHRNYAAANPSTWRNSDPSPSDRDPHGTAVSGLIAALGWNGIGSRGIAPESKVAAFRYIMSYVDQTEASALAKNLDQLDGAFDIFNYSYGYSGYVFVNEDPLVQDALELGATNLRNGRGALYVMSAGNSFYEDEYFDPCEDPLDPSATCPLSAAGNANSQSSHASPHLLVVGATNAAGVKSSYSTPGSALWISAPGGEDGISEPAMVTTDISTCSAGFSFRDFNYQNFFDFGFHPLNPYCHYTSRMNGTSSAAPVTSGVIALMLEANPNLTWREVKHILATNSDVIDNQFYPLFNTLDHPYPTKTLGGYIYDEKWIQNGAGLWFSNWYGFGRVNADRAVNAALSFFSGSLGTYITRTYDSGVISELIPNESAAGVSDTINVAQPLTIESVQLKISTDHDWPGDLAVHLVSPSGTESRVLNINSDIYSESGLASDTLLISNAFYFENAQGVWTIRVFDGRSELSSNDFRLTNWKLIINGH